ncbi:hypothetical protein B296_00053492 [Ensete ventricosum]|uniref:Uncharacterized protein n=1 Tax=Ensete ventricosum TaxID=4639 RepID=A0A426X5N7_ENSVE|nr:hypothetical protein B296_00053492 [Ensete ventricosum]
MHGKSIFCFDFHCACDAPAEVSQQWYQSQANTSKRGQLTKPPTRVASHGQTPCRGGRPWLGPLQGRPPMAKPGCKGNRLRPRPLARGRLDASKASP